VAAHRASRPAGWRTVESLDVAGMLRREPGSLLVDGIGTWLAAVLAESGAWAVGQDPGGEAAAALRAEEVIAERVADLVDAWRQRTGHVVAVSDQAGSGVVPATSAGRLFRDQLGWLNQRLAVESEQAVLVVAGRVLALPC
jgi:adenosylcobinamide kinase / adenosylcobinamide-phosphate guanylyltransferase